MGIRQGQAPVGNWWGNATPGASVTLSAGTYIGAEFQIDTDMWLYGFRAYPGGINPGVFTATIWNVDGPDQSWRSACFDTRSSITRPSPWWQVWIRPRMKLYAVSTYRFAILHFSGYNRTVNTFTAGPVTRGHFTFTKGFQSTSIFPPLATITTNNNANAVDVLADPI